MPSLFHIFNIKLNYLFCFAVIIVASYARKSLIFFLVGPRSVHSLISFLRIDVCPFMSSYSFSLLMVPFTVRVAQMQKGVFLPYFIVPLYSA